ncbi:MAG: universal stress protein [Armatimonadetes bacterium]|nr:universal stress protein [Armatimonadota bacterium]
MYRCVLVPLDGSATAAEALPHAREIALHFGARLLLVRVVQPLLVPTIPTFAGPELSAREHPGDTEAARAYLQTCAEALSALGITVQVEVRHGSPADELLECMDDYHPDLVVMATQGRGLTRLFGGQVTEALLARSSVPVLVIRAPEAADAPGG